MPAIIASEDEEHLTFCKTAIIEYLEINEIYWRPRVNNYFVNLSL